MLMTKTSPLIFSAVKDNYLWLFNKTNFITLEIH